MGSFDKTGNVASYSNSQGTNSCYFRVIGTYDDEANSSGYVSVSVEVRFYYRTFGAWHIKRYATTTNCGGTSKTWGYYDGYSTTGGYLYSSNSYSFSVYVGTGGGNVSLSVGASTTYHSSSHTEYSLGSISVSTSFSVGSYEQPIYASSLSLGATSIEMGKAIQLNVSPRSSGVSHAIYWSFGGQSGSTGLGGSGTWTIPLDSFESLMTTSNSANCTFTLYTYYDGDYVGASSQTCKVTLPESYVPALDYDIELVNPINERLIAGKSSLKITYDAYASPDGLNHATITSVAIKSVTSNNPNIDASIFTLNTSTKTITTGTLPAWSGHASYTLSLVLTIKDSRGNTLDYTFTNNTLGGGVFCYVPPLVKITSLYRCTSNGTQSAGGTYAKLVVDITDDSSPNNATYTIKYNGNVIETSNVTSRIASKGSGIYGLDITIGSGKLDTGSQYDVIFTYLSQDMATYGESYFSYTNLIPTMVMPLSLLDNGTLVSASFGEMAQEYEETTSDVVINFAKGSELRATDDDGNIIVKSAYEVLNNESCPFPVGGVYLSVNETNPSTIWDGTTWEQIAQGRALLGVGTGQDSNGTSKTFSSGDNSGEYSHKLTIAEMPSHSHSYVHKVEEYSCDEDVDTHSVGSNNESSFKTGSEGGDGYHNNMIPSFGLYVFKRLS